MFVLYVLYALSHSEKCSMCLFRFAFGVSPGFNSPEDEVFPGLLLDIQIEY